MCLAIGILALNLVLTSSPASLEAQEARKPNIIFILTDDQDAGSLQYMPRVQAKLVQKGTTFENGILTLTQCCPSRATMLRGQYAHNHKIMSGGPTLGANAFRDWELDKNTVATWLDSAGYKTALVGKYMNGYDDPGYVPPGWEGWHAGLQNAWARCLSNNGTKRCYRRHPDDVLADKAERFIRDSGDEVAPLFLWLSFNAPHAPAPYMLRDEERFSSVALPKSPSFDEEDVSDKPEWVSSRSPLTPEQLEGMEIFHRNRLRSLQTVDRAVGRLIDALHDTRRLKDTYLVFWTDNGHHMGEHRLPAVNGSPGKSTPYMEDTEVPLIVRGPGVPQAKRQELVLNTDIAPTFAQLARAQAPDFVDGRSFVPLLRGQTPPWRTAGLIENRVSPKLSRPAYVGMVTQDTAYVEYDSGEKELYDLVADPYQLNNIYTDADPALKEALATRLEALRSCAGQACKEAEDGPVP